VRVVKAGHDRKERQRWVNGGLQEVTFGLSVETCKERVPYFPGWADWVVGVPRVRRSSVCGGALVPATPTSRQSRCPPSK